MDNYNYHKGMNVIIQELKVLLKTKSIGTDSDQALLLDFQETLATIYLMTANLPQAKTYFKRAFKIYEKIRKSKSYIHRLVSFLDNRYQVF